MKLIVKKGTTSKRIFIFVLDSSKTDGSGLAGLTNGSSGLAWYFAREDDGNAGGTAVSIVSATLGTFTSGGFKEKDSTHLPGVYEISIPNAALATGSDTVVMMLRGAANMVPVLVEIQLVAYDPADGVRLGLTSLPNAAAEAAGGLYTRGSGAGQINQSSNGQVDAKAVAASAALIDSTVLADGAITAAKIASNAITAAKIATDAIGAAQLAADAVTEIQTGLATSAAVAAIPTSNPSAAAIRAEMDSNSTKLAHLQADITATPPDAAHFTNARGDLLAHLDADISSRASAAALATAQTAITDIQTDVDELQTSVAAIPTAAVPTANQNADALLDRSAAIDGKTPRVALAIAASVMGKSSGEPNPTFFGLDGTTPRVVFTVDGSNNRTGATYP